MGIRGWRENALGVQHLDIGVDGALPSPDHFLSGIGLITLSNGPATGLSALSSPRTWTYMSKLKDGEGRYLTMPAEYNNLKKLGTTQILTTLSHGSSGAVCTDIFLGDFSQMLIGIRTELKLEVSKVAADTASSAFSNMQVFVRGYLRADLILTQPTSFVLIDGVKNA